MPGEYKKENEGKSEKKASGETSTRRPRTESLVIPNERARESVHDGRGVAYTAVQQYKTPNNENKKTSTIGSRFTGK